MRSSSNNKVRVSSKPSGKRPQSNINNIKVPPKLTRTSTDEERLAYYRNKYGEDFKLDSSFDKKKEDFFGKLFGSKRKKGKRMHPRAVSEAHDQEKK